MANKEQEAVDWFIGRARSEAGYRKNILSNDQRAQDDTVIGKLYFFKYDPKLKKTLPIYDIYPLVSEDIYKKRKGLMNPIYYIIVNLCGLLCWC